MSDNPRSLATIIVIIIITAFLSAIATKTLAPATSGESLEKALTDFIIKNPTVIGNAVKQAYELEQKQAEEAAAENVNKKRDELENDPKSPFAGNPNGSKVLVEFFDYNCGYCKRVLPDVTALIAEDKDLKVVMKELPILGDMSHLASKVAMAVNKQNPDKYWGFHQSLLNQGAHSEDQIIATLKTSGLDRTKIMEVAKNDKDIDAQLEKHTNLASDIGVRGTPAFVASGQLVRGAQGKDALKAALEGKKVEE